MEGIGGDPKVGKKTFPVVSSNTVAGGGSEGVIEKILKEKKKRKKDTRLKGGSGIILERES